MPKKKAAKTAAVKPSLKKGATKRSFKKVGKSAAARAPKSRVFDPPGAKAPLRKKPAITASPTVTVPSAPPVLGRPLVTQEEKLYMLFHDDYQCRQVFEFLRVETVKELEEYTPQQIVHLMSRPIRLTVDRIRKRLAEFKRALKEDGQFAADFQQARPGAGS